MYQAVPNNYPTRSCAITTTYFTFDGDGITMADESEQRVADRDRLDPGRIPAALASDDPTTRRAAADAFGSLASEDVETAVAHAGVVAEHVNDESLAVARAAADAVEPIARERPDALLDQIEPIVESLAAETIDLSVAGARVLSPLAVARPDAVTEYVDRLLEILAEDEVPTPETAVPETVGRGTRQMLESVQRESLERRQYVRQTAADVVVAVAESEPSHLDDVERVETLLDDADPAVAGAAVDALGVVAQSEPDRIAPALESLLDCLDHDVAAVRARAIRALGYLGDASAVPRLEAVAEEGDGDVAELAAETAAFLSET